MTESLVIGNDSEVILHFDLKLEDGSAADSTRVNNKPAKLVMGDGSLTPNFEACLVGLKKGDKKAFTLEANDAFGEPNPNNMHYMDRSRFGADLKIEEGMILAFAQPDGSEIPGIIRSVAGDSVTVDFNHPLAGQTVIFDVEILDVKPGTHAQSEN
ncbi:MULTISPECIES: FKBP-type peptidyl-prolyl cis-trans isomerase [Alteromonas]|jgi:FKBP-type peptidyl-prolyl cis-trans isomerase SlpA|uniref:Peptidyl-prolyl cis-trans isomerase n=1 Tax=Alteromonas hispanica TaxID=315421 RepID=A0A6L9MUB5_9ALTE|nr:MULTISPECIES: FKBP-type peptidyl-prolyl cis-trans isomerase [Alteromonas]AUC89020.1 peptidylprolyl isomerase [Alteromonas sp. MB-3u-76]NDW21503.1 FKBP-type peptidyl-prolyl cis-trans isomerase [Alteromonas hispanica]